MVPLALQQQLVEIRRHLHQYPELSLQEYETTSYIQEKLQQYGITLRDTSLATGVFADIIGQSGPIIAVRADIDALPITEATQLPYASKIAGKMHACGHDFHTAALLGAAQLLQQKRLEMQGTVRLIFQPAEELGGGAAQVIADGQLRDVKAIIGLHNKPDLAVGTVGIKAGALMAAVDAFKITITGKGSHAAIPQAGTDVIVTAAQLITQLQTIVSRNVSPLQSAVVSVTAIHGGATWNVLPEQVTLEGTIRTFDEHVRQKVKARFYQLTESLTTMHHQQSTIIWQECPPALHNHASLAQKSMQVATQQNLTVIEPEPTMGGEDFAQYLRHIPGIFTFFGTGGTEEWHHPKFTIDETALAPAAYYLYESALQILINLKKGDL